MIIRELVTLLRYDADTRGIDTYTHALKGLLGTLAGLFAVHEVMELADEWATIAGRVRNVTASVQEQTDVMNKLQAQAEATGQSFEGIGSLFAQLKTTGSSLGYTTEQILGLTESISKLTTLGGGTAAGGRRGMIQIEEMFSVGKVQMQHLRALMIDIPGAVDVLSKSLDGGKKKFMEMVHSGQMTSDVFAGLFLKSADEINTRFLRMPLTFARAFETVHSFLGRLVYDIGQATDVWTDMARNIIWTVREIVDSIRWMAKEVGGWGNLLRTSEILAAGAFGPGAILMVIRFISALRALTLASVLAAAPWYLMAAGIVAVGLLIDDIMGWMDGKDSLIGDWLGPYKDWRDTLKQAWDIVRPMGEVLIGIWVASKVVAWGNALGVLVATVLPAASAAFTFMTGAITGVDLAAVGLLGTLAGILGTLALIAIAAGSLYLGFRIPKAGDTAADRAKSGMKPAGTPLPYTPEEQFKRDNPWTALWRSVTGQAPGSTGERPDVGGFSDYINKLRNQNGGIPVTSAVPGSTSNTTNNVTIATTVNTASDTPAAVGDAAGSAARDGVAAGLGRDLRNAAPAAEFGREQ